ncbi:MAG: metallophosphoesterase [Oscillospiraceae bacterium]|nr:metallophosphoesterase [Oscillospiraceae bacterium]
MALFVIADTHLSLSTDKPMDIFNGWDNYMERLEKNWRALVSEKDTVVIPGDVSWAMDLKDCEKDFAFLQALPGRKILMKGNHDYWWTTKKKMDAYLEEKGFDSLHILSNNSFEYENVAICGTRGWIFEGGQPQDQKIVAREAGRLKMSLEDAEKRFPDKEKLVFLHYPPVYGNETNESILQVLRDFGIKRCWYGHIHSAGCRFALNGEYEGVEYRLISADYLKFTPKIIHI